MGQAALITAREAAQRLGISTPTFYAWLRQSRTGGLVLRGHCTKVNYFQGGQKGQGRILIEEVEVERLKECMRVVSHQPILRRPPTPSRSYPGIHVPLGRPVEIVLGDR